MRPTVYLFDIDGTLLDGGGAGRRSMEGAFADVTGDRDALRRTSFAGMTDPAIVRAGLRAIASDAERDEDLIAQVIARYLARLPDEIAQSETFRLHTGVEAVLAELAREQHAAIGLGTGNVEPGARIKLGPLGVVDAFAFGGYGSDHEDRPTLVGIGAARGCNALGCTRADARVVVIGDTPKDVHAALAIGAECLAVATGWFGVADLQAAGATLAVADLDDPAARRWLRGGSALS